MTTIHCRDKFLSETDLTAFGNALKDRHAKLKTPVNTSEPVTSTSAGTSSVLVRDPVVVFDETIVSRDAIEEILAEYGFAERL